MMMNSTSGDQMSEVENCFEQLFYFFRSSNLKSEEYIVALYLLYVYKQKANLKVTVEHSNYKFMVRLPELNSHTNLLDVGEARILNETFKPILEKMEYRNLTEILDIISKINHNFLQGAFSEIFDRLLYRISKSQGRASGEFLMPKELSRLMCSLFDLPKNAKVYNPFAGLASFGVFLKQDIFYFGQELNQTTWAVGVLRLMAHEPFGNSKYILGDSINQWQGQGAKYDLIISNPPFGMRLTNNTSGMFGNIKTAEQFLIEKGIESLKPNGKLVVCISPGLLFNSGEAEILRRYLIESDLLELVISLPGGILSNSGISTSILVIAKNKKDKGSVRFVDAKGFIAGSTNKGKILNDLALTNAIRNGTESDIVKFVSNEVIASNDFNLNAQRYFLKPINYSKQDEKIVALHDISKVVGGQRISDVQTGRFVRLRDLKDDKLDFLLDLEQVEEIQLPKFAKRIDESCLILATRWKTLKPTYFIYNGSPIYLSLDAVAIKVDESKILLSYLINELHSDYVKEQIDAKRVGTVVPFIRKIDLFNTKIKIPKLPEQQKSIMNAVTNAIAEEKKKELVLFSKIHGLEGEIIEQNKYLRHVLAGPASNLKGSLMNIRTIINDKIIHKIPNLMDIKVTEKHDLNFGQYWEIIERNINNIVEAVSNSLKVDTNLEETTLKPIELISFLKNFEKEFKDRKDINYTLTFDFDEIDFTIDEVGIAKAFILADENLLRDLLNNLISNSVKHAFINNGNHRIEIYLMKTTLLPLVDLPTEGIDAIQVLFSNTGIGLPEDFQFDDFTRKGSKAGLYAGDGFGGWYIDQIIKKLGGNFDIINEQGPEGIGNDFATSFEINIPMTENESNDEI